MSDNQVFIEFGSLATKVIDSSSQIGIKSILHPFDLVDNDGNFNKLIFTKRIFLPLKEYLNQDSFSGIKVKGFATGIYRTAQNRNEIISLLNSIKLIELDVLTAEQECIQSFNSYWNTHSPKTSHNIVYVDMGGGSTELALFKNGLLEEYRSLPIGVLKLAVIFFDGNGNLDEGILRVHDIINKYFVENLPFIHYLADYLKKDKSSLIVTGMVVKKIKNKYKNENSIDIENYEKLLNELKLSLMGYENVRHLKRVYMRPKQTLVDKINLYLGGLFLFKILTGLQARTFYINDKGLHYSFFEEK